ncbi:UNVERIFIED_CONTAM: hypothetical protein NCL1_50492 [Trichonephila clavipes]
MMMTLIVRSSCHLAWGSYDYCFDEKNEITRVKWKDNKCVTTATNCDYIEPLIQVSRHQRSLEEKSQILQPDTVHQVIDMPIINKYILFNLTNYEKKCIKDIGRYIAVAYLKRGTNSKKDIERPLMMSSRSNTT